MATIQSFFKKKVDTANQEEDKNAVTEQSSDQIKRTNANSARENLSQGSSSCSDVGVKCSNDQFLDVPSLTKQVQVKGTDVSFVIYLQGCLPGCLLSAGGAVGASVGSVYIITYQA